MVFLPWHLKPKGNHVETKVKLQAIQKQRGRQIALGQGLSDPAFRSKCCRKSNWGSDTKPGTEVGLRHRDMQGTSANTAITVVGLGRKLQPQTGRILNEKDAVTWSGHKKPSLPQFSRKDRQDCTLRATLGLHDDGAALAALRCEDGPNLSKLEALLPELSKILQKTPPLSSPGLVLVEPVAELVTFSGQEPTFALASYGQQPPLSKGPSTVLLARGFWAKSETFLATASAEDGVPGPCSPRSKGLNRSLYSHQPKKALFPGSLVIFGHVSLNV